MSHPNQELRAAKALQDTSKKERAAELASRNKAKANELLRKMLAESALSSEVSTVSTGVEIYA